MSQKSREGNKAFKQAKAQGKSREECIEASNQVKAEIDQSYINPPKGQTIPANSECRKGSAYTGYAHTADDL